MDGKTFKDKESAGEAIAKATSVVRAAMEEELVVKYRGLEFTFTSRGGALVADSQTGNIGVWAGAEPFSGTGFVQRMKNYVDRLPAAQEDTKAHIEKARKDIVALREQAKQPFAQAKELEAAREEYKKVQRALLAKGPDVPDNQKAVVASGIQAQKAKLEKLGYGEALREFFAGSDTQPKFNVKDDNSFHDDADPGQADNSADTRRAIDVLKRGLAKRDGVETSVQGWTSRGILGVAPIAQAFGTKVAGYKIGEEAGAKDPSGLGQANGLHYLGTTYLNSDASRPHLAILGHETAHEMRRKRPDIYNKLVDAIAQYVDTSAYDHKFKHTKVTDRCSNHMGPSIAS